MFAVTGLSAAVRICNGRQFKFTFTSRNFYIFSRIWPQFIHEVNIRLGFYLYEIRKAIKTTLPDQISNWLPGWRLTAYSV